MVLNIATIGLPYLGLKDEINLLAASTTRVLTFPLNEMYGFSQLCDRLRLYGNSSLCDRLRSYGNQPLKECDGVECPYKYIAKKLGCRRCHHISQTHARQLDQSHS